MVALNNSTQTKNIEDIPLRKRLDLSKMTVEQRYEYIRKLTVWHPQMIKIWDTITECHKTSKPSEPECMSLFGPTRVGKSHIVKLYRKKHSKFNQKATTQYPKHGKINAEITITPVLYTEVKCPASIGAVACALLEALGDPFFDSNEKYVYTKTAKLQKLLKICSVELIILDEIQHFVDRNKKKLLEDSSDWLKTDIIDKTGIPVVIVGTNEGERIFSNPQLNGRFLNRETLLPFSRKITGNEMEFRHVLQIFDDNLPLKEESRLSSQDTWERIYLATNGRMYYLKELLKRSTKLALNKGFETINHPTMSAVYEKHLSFLGICEGNPFEPDYNLEKALTLDFNKKIEAYGTPTNNRMNSRKTEELPRLF